MVSVAWESPLWRALAWRYFFDVFAPGGVRYAVETRAQAQVDRVERSEVRRIYAR
jgi:hypothetical protein